MVVAQVVAHRTTDRDVPGFSSLSYQKYVLNQVPRGGATLLISCPQAGRHPLGLGEPTHSSGCRGTLSTDALKTRLLSPENWSSPTGPLFFSDGNSSQDTHF